jgi:hypothetical protein
MGENKGIRGQTGAGFAGRNKQSALQFGFSAVPSLNWHSQPTFDGDSAMAKEEAKTIIPSASETEIAPAPPQVQINVDMAGVNNTYTNWYRVIGTPEELILDFGLNAEHGPYAPTQPIKISDRVVMSFYTAKRLLQHLQLALSRHEGAFGALEIDFQRRAQTGRRQ